jgi:hypothetical protein
MKLIKLVLYAAGAVIIMAVVGTLAAPKLAATIRGAFVEVVIPSRPFYDSMSVLNSVVSVGPDTGTLGVSNITLRPLFQAAAAVVLSPAVGHLG